MMDPMGGDDDLHLVHHLSLCGFLADDFVVDHNVEITVISGVGCAREFSPDHVVLLRIVSGARDNRVSAMRGEG